MSETNSPAAFTPRFFFTDNCMRRIRAGKRIFRFESVQQFAGGWKGVFKAETRADAELLADLAKVATNGVVEIPEAEYADWMAKKNGALSVLPPAVSNPVPTIPVALTGTGSVRVVENPSPEDPEEPLIAGAPVSEENALQLGNVTEVTAPEAVKPSILPAQPPPISEAPSETPQPPAE